MLFTPVVSEFDSSFLPRRGYEGRTGFSFSIRKICTSAVNTMMFAERLLQSAQYLSLQ